MLDPRKLTSLAFTLVLLSSAALVMAQATAPAPAETPAATEPAAPIAVEPTVPAPPVAPAALSDEDAGVRLANRIKLFREKAEVDIAASLTRANEILAKAATAGDFQAAQDAVDTARNILQANKIYFETAAFSTRSNEIEDRARFVAKQRATWQAGETAVQTREIEQADIARRAMVRDQQRLKVEKLNDQAKSLIREKKYKLAMDVLDQILKLDPSNREAFEQRALLAQIDILIREKENFETRNLETDKTEVELKSQEIPWYEIARYPKEWREITASRERYSATSGAGGESELDRETQRRLDTTRIDRTNFDGFAFGDVITWLSTNARVNIHVKWAILKDKDITPETKIKSVQLTNVTAEKALRIVLEDVGGSAAALTYLIDDGVITISTKEDLANYRKTLVYDIRDLIFTLKPFQGPKIDLSAMTSGGSVGNNSSSSSSSGSNIFGQTAATTENTVTRDQIVEKIKKMITSTIDPGKWTEATGTPTAEQAPYPEEFNGQLIITQTAQNHRAVLDLINRLREAKNIQVSIETRFLEVSTDFYNAIGLNLNTTFNLGSHLTTGAVDSATGAATPSLNNTTPWTNPANGINAQPGTDKMTPVGIQQSGWAWARDPGTNLSSLSTTPAMKVQGSFLDDIQVDFLMEATQANQTNRSLTSPRLTMFNGQKAYVAMATFQAYVSTYTADANSTLLTPVIQWLPSGSTMTVEATVSADRRYVTLTISPSLTVSNRGPAVFLQSGGGLGTQFPLYLPTMTTQMLETIVSVPDGGTLLLGGQNKSTDNEREMGVPLLDKIPVINRLFDNRSRGRDEDVILILVKPKIIIQQEEEEKQFP